MKNVIFIIVGIFCFSCASKKYVANENNGKLEIKDSAKYELVIFDSGFDYWLASHQTLAGTYSNEYYQSQNYLFANEWNRRYAQGDPRFNSYIDYSYNVDYGFDFNYKLYMYFKFFEDVNRIRLIPGSRRIR